MIRNGEVVHEMKKPEGDIRDVLESKYVTRWLLLWFNESLQLTHLATGAAKCRPIQEQDNILHSNWRKGVKTGIRSFLAVVRPTPVESESWASVTPLHSWGCGGNSLKQNCTSSSKCTECTFSFKSASEWPIFFWKYFNYHHNWFDLINWLEGTV